MLLRFSQIATCLCGPFRKRDFSSGWSTHPIPKDITWLRPSVGARGPMSNVISGMTFVSLPQQQWLMATTAPAPERRSTIGDSGPTSGIKVWVTSAGEAQVAAVQQLPSEHQIGGHSSSELLDSGTTTFPFCNQGRYLLSAVS